MSVLDNMKIGKKVIAGFVIVGFVIVAAIAAVIGIQKVKTIDATDTKSYEQATAHMKDALDMATYFQRIRVNVRDALLAETPADAQGFVYRSEQIRELMMKAEENWARTFVDEQDKKNFEAFHSAFDEYWVINQRIGKLAIEQKDNEGIALMRGDGKKANDAAQGALDVLAQYMVDQAKKISDACG